MAELQKNLSRTYKGKRYYKHEVTVAQAFVKKHDLKDGDEVRVIVEKKKKK